MREATTFLRIISDYDSNSGKKTALLNHYSKKQVT